METEAQRRAGLKYRREKMKQLSIRFGAGDFDVFEFVQGKENTAGYVKAVLREAMEREMQADEHA